MKKDHYKIYINDENIFFKNKKNKIIIIDSYKMFYHKKIKSISNGLIKNIGLLEIILEKLLSKWKLRNLFVTKIIVYMDVMPDIQKHFLISIFNKIGYPNVVCKSMLKQINKNIIGIMSNYLVIYQNRKTTIVPYDFFVGQQKINKTIEYLNQIIKNDKYQIYGSSKNIKRIINKLDRKVFWIADYKEYIISLMED